MRLRLLIVAAAVAIALLPVLWSASRLHQANGAILAAQQSLQQTTVDAERILTLRAKQQTVAEQKRPDQDVIARITTVLADAGIPSDHFAGLRPEADAALTSNSSTEAVRYRRQSVRISLNDLKVSQIGEFLSRWSATQPLWVPNQIELTHSRNPTNSDTYSVSLLLIATYVSNEDHP